DQLGLGRDDGDRLAPVTDLVLGEQRLVGRHPESLEVAVDVLGDILVRDYGVHPAERLGLARVEARDARVVVRRAERLGPEHLRDADVVDELRAAGDVAEAVVPRKTCADGLPAGLPLIATSGPPSSTSGPSRPGSTSPRDP